MELKTENKQWVGHVPVKLISDVPIVSFIETLFWIKYLVKVLKLYYYGNN